MAEVSNAPLFLVTYHDDGSFPGAVCETTLLAFKMQIIGMESSGQHPGIVTGHYAIYDDKVEANREAIRRLKLMRAVVDQEIAELEEEIADLAEE